MADIIKVRNKQTGEVFNVRRKQQAPQLSESYQRLGEAITPDIIPEQVSQFLPEQIKTFE